MVWKLPMCRLVAPATGEAKPSLMTTAMQRWSLCGSGESSLCVLSLLPEVQLQQSLGMLFLSCSWGLHHWWDRHTGQLPAWSTLLLVPTAINTVLLFLGTVFEQAVHPSRGLHQSRLSFPRLPPVILNRAESKAWLKLHAASPLSTKLIELPRRKIKLVCHDFILTNTRWLVLISLLSFKCL